MTTVIKIAWRNIWRNKFRTAVILTAIVLGIWAIIFITSFSNGMVKSYINNSVETEVSHLQIHDSLFLKDKEIQYYIANPKVVQTLIASINGIQSSTRRTLTNAMLSSTKGARGIRVKAIDPSAEKTVTNIAEKIVAGDFLEVKKRNPILLSRRLAKKMKLKIRSKVVLTFTDLHGEVIAASFRVIGLFESGITPFDEGNVFIKSSDLNTLLAENASLNVNQSPSKPMPSIITHEFALKVNNPSDIPAIASSLQEKLPNLKVQTYKDVAPELELYESSIGLTGIIVMTIFMLALVFGIINTMLMAVLERYRELGMLMAIGMNKKSVFWMIVLETLFLGLIAAPIGILLGYLTVTILHQTGIDLSAYSTGIESFGMSKIVRPSLEVATYIQLTVAVFITAIIGALYPAWKAIQLKPVEAIRSI